MNKRSIEKGEDKNVLLISVANNMEAESIIQILNDQGIPVLKKHKGSGDYLNIMMGYTPFGIELLVPIELHEKAKTLIEGMCFVNGVEHDEEDEKNMYLTANKLMKIFIRLFLLSGIAITIWTVISSYLK